MKFAAKRDPPASTVGFFFAANFIQNFYTVLKKRLWESGSTPTLDLLQFQYTAPPVFCELCQVTTPSMTDYEKHLVGKQHLKRLTEQQWVYIIGF
jgi:hypothetical protein